MKQRLGIAAALLKAPRLLILDEPSNGLDPAGIRDVRELIRRLGADGRTTVLLSSHLLAEIEQVCDSRVDPGPRPAGRVGPGAPRCWPAVRSGDVRVRVPDAAAAAAVLTSAGLPGLARVRGRPCSSAPSPRRVS